MNLRIGVCSWSFAGILRGSRPIEEITRKAYGAGFYSFEAAYNRRAPLSIRQNPPDSNAASITSLATLELHRFHLTDPVATRRQNALDTVSAMIDCAARSQIPSISFSPGRLREGQEVERVLDALADDLAPLVEESKKMGVTVALENLPGHLLVRRAAMLGILERLPDARVCLDIGNTLFDPPFSEWVRLLSTKIFKLHISDGDICGGMFHARKPGQGKVDWGSVLDEVKKIDRDVDAFVEMPLTDGEDETELLSSLSSSVRVLFRSWL